MTNHSHTSLLAVALAAALLAPLAMAQGAAPTATTNQTPIAPTQAMPQAPNPATPPIHDDTPTAAVPNNTATPSAPATPAQGAMAQTPAASQSTTSTGQKSWNDLDTDKDGNLSKSEAAADPGMKALFAKADANGDGQLSGDEYRSYYAKYQASATRK